MDLARNIKNIEKLISEDRIALAIQALQELLENDTRDYFSSESSNLLSLTSRYNRNEKAFKEAGTLQKDEYDLELGKIIRGIFSIRDKIEANSDKLILVQEKPLSGSQGAVEASDNLVEKATKIVVLALMAIAAILLIIFIAFPPNEETQVTGILASGGVVFVSLFKQTLDKYLRLRFS